MATALQSLRTRLYLVSLTTLLLGLGIALALYLSADEPIDNIMITEFRNSKVFRHELEVYGGKMSLLGDQLNRWFAELWHGKQLGITVACISVTLATLIAVAARHVTSDNSAKQIAITNDEHMGERHDKGQ